MDSLSHEEREKLEKFIADMREDEKKLFLQVLQTQIRLDELRLKLWKAQVKLDREKRED
jgi:predicted  nucleic acid-binding Zn-ribbon protein